MEDSDSGVVNKLATMVDDWVVTLLAVSSEDCSVVFDETVDIEWWVVDAFCVTDDVGGDDWAVEDGIGQVNPGGTGNKHPCFSSTSPRNMKESEKME